MGNGTARLGAALLGAIIASVSAAAQEWKLVDTKRVVTPDRAYTPARWEGAPPAIVARKSWINLDKKTLTIVTSFAWSGIQGSMKPGEEFSVSVTLDQAVNTQTGYNSWIKAYMGWPSTGVEVDGPDAQGDWREGKVTRRNAGKWRVPPGSNDTLQIRIYARVGQDIHETRYLYRFASAPTQPPAPTAAAAAIPGSVWTVVEVGEWFGTWTRRGGSNVFDAVWRHRTTPGQWRDVLTVESIEGNRMVIFRQGMNGRYQATLSADRKTLTGTASWYQPGQSWSGQIR